MARITYNGAEMELEPYQILIRNEALYLAAFNPRKSRRSDEEPRLGYFKIAGMKQVELTISFEPSSAFLDSQSKTNERVLLAVD